MILNILEFIINGNLYNNICSQILQIDHTGCGFHLIKALLSWLRDNGLSKYLTSSAYYDIDLPAFIRKVTALSFLNIEAINDTYKEIIATEQPRFPAG